MTHTHTHTQTRAVRLPWARDHPITESSTMQTEFLVEEEAVMIGRNWNWLSQFYNKSNVIWLIAFRLLHFDKFYIFRTVHCAIYMSERITRHTLYFLYLFHFYYPLHVLIKHVHHQDVTSVHTAYNSSNHNVLAIRHHTHECKMLYAAFTEVTIWWWTSLFETCRG